MSAALAFALCSCSDDDETEGDFTPTVFNVMGKVEKGPMIRGSHVDMRTLDEYMTPTGNFYSATIDNNLGDFNYGALKINSPYAQLTADGYFFNEVDGELTAIKLTIHAPWWKTTTAYILYAVILLLIAFTGIRLYIYWSRKEMERKHKEEILLLRIRNLIEQNNSLTCGIEETSPDHQQQDTEESAFLAQAIKLVEQNLHVNGYSVEQLSRDLCMERTGLYRKLVTMLDQSPSLFIRNIRLQRAAQLITEGKLSITEIAEHTGFSSSSYLSKCFQEMYGCRPSEYAEKVKKST